MRARDQLSFDFKLDYQVKRQRRKSLGIYVLPDARVEVRAPQWVSRRDLDHFVRERLDWALEQRHKILNRLATQPRYLDGFQHPYLDGSLPLRVRTGDKDAVQLTGSSLHIELKDPTDEARVERLVNDWYRQQARQVFARRVAALLPRLPGQRVAPDIKVRAMKRRWGSCSNRNTVTLNLALMKLPLRCVDYVIAHELCHLIEFNHSPRFYQLLTAVMPDWRERETLMEQYG